MQAVRARLEQVSAVHDPRPLPGVARELNHQDLQAVVAHSSPAGLRLPEDNSSRDVSTTASDTCRPLRRIPQSAALGDCSLRGMTGSADETCPGVVIWTAVSCPAAQGPGGWAFAAYSDGRDAGCALGGELSTTRPRMDFAAAAEALEALARPCAVTLWRDSKYLVTGMADGWLLRWERSGMRTSERNSGKLPANMDLWDRVRLAAESHHVTWRRIRRDAASPGSERAHQLAAAARQAAADGNAPVFQVSSSSDLINPCSDAAGVLTSGALDPPRANPVVTRAAT
jgi:ribonuclease HI